jgi:hypothetical protein
LYACSNDAARADLGPTTFVLGASVNQKEPKEEAVSAATQTWRKANEQWAMFFKDAGQLVHSVAELSKPVEC